MHHDDAPRRPLAANRLAKPATLYILGNHAREVAVLGVMIEKLSVSAGNDLHTTVGRGSIVQIDHHGHQVVIRMGQIGQVLMPFDHRSHLGRFHVQLAVMEIQVVAQNYSDCIDQPVISGQITEILVHIERVVSRWTDLIQ